MGRLVVQGGEGEVRTMGQIIKQQKIGTNHQHSNQPIDSINNSIKQEALKNSIEEQTFYFT